MEASTNSTSIIEYNTFGEDVVSKLLVKYSYGDTQIKDCIIEAFLRVMRMLDHDSEQLNGIRVLDLGCGSTVPKDLMETIQVTSDRFKKIKIPDNIPYELFSIYSNNEVKHIRDYEPWFCRVLQEIGASPVGIDSGYLDEEFEHYALDLSQKGVLDFLENNSFDFVIANGLFDSPHLNERFPKEKIDEMRIELLNQSKRLLKNKDQKIECFW